MTIRPLVEKLFDSLNEIQINIILVNDGSIDKTGYECEQIANKYSNVKYIELRKNFGEHNAVMCALNYVEGDYAVIIDDDFQNPPEEILKFMPKMELGYDVIYSFYEKKRHHFLRNIGSKFNNYVANLILDKPSELYLSSFKAIKKEVIEEIVKYNAPFPYIDGLILSVTRNIATVEVMHHEREHGKSNYTFTKLITLWLNMFINFSIRPLRMFTVLGFFITSVSFFFASVLIFQRLNDSNIQPGWSSTFVAIMFFSGLQTIFIGLLSEYIGKNYLTSANSPQWSIKKIIP
jgi:undecaprenyl-phosphate 4-deoxy-4-formamido-L-arabinose transferase